MSKRVKSHHAVKFAVQLWEKAPLLILFIGLFTPVWTCSEVNAQERNVIKNEVKFVKPIETPDHFKRLIESSADRLLVIDLYADWCLPCKVLSPMLEEIAQDNKDKASFYKMDIDKNTGVARALGVSGIPYVVFIKNETLVHSLMGLHPKGTYVRAINSFAQEDSRQTSDLPDGEIIEGVRIIKLSTATKPDNIYVFRGETVKLIIEKIDYPYSIHIPEYQVSKEAIPGEDLTVTFKAKTIGVFPIFCNGNCPTGDGTRYGQIVVMQYKAQGDTEYLELNAKQAKELIEKSSPLILDVRTPNEYYRGNIEDSRLIPLQQLEMRLSEIEQYKGKEILLYCRSGNRSTVAAEILNRNGFKKLYNLKHGIIDWKKSGYKVLK
jgi:thioredoxin